MPERGQGQAMLKAFRASNVSNWVIRPCLTGPDVQSSFLARTAPFALLKAGRKFWASQVLYSSSCSAFPSKISHE